MTAIQPYPTARPPAVPASDTPRASVQSVVLFAMATLAERRDADTEGHLLRMQGWGIDTSQILLAGDTYTAQAIIITDTDNNLALIARAGCGKTSTRSPAARLSAIKGSRASTRPWPLSAACTIW